MNRIPPPWAATSCPQHPGSHVRIVTNQSQPGGAVPRALRRRGLTSRLVRARLDESGTEDAAEAVLGSSQLPLACRAGSLLYTCLRLFVCFPRFAGVSAHAAALRWRSFAPVRAPSW